MPGITGLMPVGITTGTFLNLQEQEMFSTQRNVVDYDHAGHVSIAKGVAFERKFLTLSMNMFCPPGTSGNS